MKNLLIIYPHWPPSNLTGVHRPRLIANFAEHFGCHPIVLTVKNQFYEEPPDWDLIKTVNPNIEVYYTNAWKVPKPRIFGDIGIRSFIFLYKKALQIINSKQIDFIWIPIPSFYVALLGRILYEKTHVPYSIDYIDPWLRDITGRKNLRAKLSNLLAKILEPLAIKKASLITGVDEKYFLPALKRTFKKTKNYTTYLAFPYGFDPHDFDVAPKNITTPWHNCNCKPIIYAGAFLPNSKLFYSLMFQTIAQNKNYFNQYKFFFIGSGPYSIQQLATQYHVQDIIIEINQRFPYLHILSFLKQAHGILVIGSTEEHYTASKIFQALLSNRPVFAIFHLKSQTVKILQQANADNFLVLYNPNENISELKNKISQTLINFLNAKPEQWKPNLQALNNYSAKENTKKFCQTIKNLLSSNY